MKRIATHSRVEPLIGRTSTELRIFHFGGSDRDTYTIEVSDDRGTVQYVGVPAQRRGDHMFFNLSEAQHTNVPKA